jgi:hypothetical protein
MSSHVINYSREHKLSETDILRLRETAENVGDGETRILLSCGTAHVAYGNYFIDGGASKRVPPRKP